LAFRLGTVAACGVVHHGRGTPIIGAYSGGPLDVYELLRNRRAIREGTDPNCERCPYLVHREWPALEYPVTWLGITHFNHCNIECEYCWLQWADYSPRKLGNREQKPYDVFPLIKELIEAKLLSPRAMIDWGGGGESTLMPDFDATFELLCAYGPAQWIHTNAVRVPQLVRRGGQIRSAVRVLCSLDAGRASTYAAIKRRDHFATVCDNLRRYIRSGAYVALKYIVTDVNCQFAELDDFIAFACELRPFEVVADIDLRAPNPKPEIVEALGYLAWRCAEFKIPFQFGSTGVNHARESDVQARMRIAWHRLRKLRAPAVV
jgi:sulfatase maturation enzyme AslB (radical SAM superfamily)